MANFNPETYETVEDRIKRFYGDHPDGRIVTEDYTTGEDRKGGVWRVKATVYYDGEEQARNTPKATGYAFEVDGRGMTQGANALETCETSAIGRALANGGYSGSKRPTREEMTKAERQGPTRQAIQANRTPASPEQIEEAVDKIHAAIADGKITRIDQARIAYSQVKRMGAEQKTLDDLAKAFTALADPAKAEA